ncbi:monofunctional biosynthetic peptidoglycan transglycosylase [Marinobacterium aestuariivivens]|uniref:Monofunctional biosynthetic peptidoglycan transglycosylase n=1 Tax=Marinobacterium aestuariivivens TaxID=1698799 RepID=A0ABW2A838_9GAMM
MARDRISPSMQLAVIAAEDQRFPEHNGFDFKAIQRALDHNFDGGRLRGASTLTQQTAKNLFLWSGRSWVRKGLEAWFALLLELLWDKGRILEVYLNIVEFGPGIYGVEAAGRYYFGVPARQLGPWQSARLAAVLPNPYRYRAQPPSPYVERRSRWIAQQMRQLGNVTLEAVDR